MKKPDPLLFALQDMVIDLALIDRKHYLAKNSRHENDIEHTFSVVLLCWYIHSKYDIKLDISKILKYALAHDFVERYAGDVNTFASKQAREQKARAEAQSLNRLSKEFGEFPDLIAAMTGYEEKQDDESLFVWTVDKMQALIMGDLDSWRPYRELEISYEHFCDRYSELLSGSSDYSNEIFKGLIEYSKTTYYDRPKS